MATLFNQLKDHLENGKDWEALSTPVPGVNVVKTPGGKTRPPMLYLEINPLKEDGTPVKRKGLFIRDFEMLVKFSEALTNDTILRIIKEIEKVNPKEIYQKPAIKKLEI